jgi:hypothetical protein
MAFQAIKLDCSVYFDQKDGFFYWKQRFFNETIFKTCSLIRAIFYTINQI